MKSKKMFALNIAIVSVMLFSVFAPMASAAELLRATETKTDSVKIGDSTAVPATGIDDKNVVEITAKVADADVKDVDLSTAEIEKGDTALYIYKDLNHGLEVTNAEYNENVFSGHTTVAKNADLKETMEALDKNLTTGTSKGAVKIPVAEVQVKVADKWVSVKPSEETTKVQDAILAKLNEGIKDGETKKEAKDLVYGENYRIVALKDVYTLVEAKSAQEANVAYTSPACQGYQFIKVSYETKFVVSAEEGTVYYADIATADAAKVDTVYVKGDANLAEAPANANIVVEEGKLTVGALSLSKNITVKEGAELVVSGAAELKSGCNVEVAGKATVTSTGSLKVNDNATLSFNTAEVRLEGLVTATKYGNVTVDSKTVVTGSETVKENENLVSALKNKLNVFRTVKTFAEGDDVNSFVHPEENPSNASSLQVGLTEGNKADTVEAGEGETVYVSTDLESCYEITEIRLYQKVATVVTGQDNFGENITEQGFKQVAVVEKSNSFKMPAITDNATEDGIVYVQVVYAATEISIVEEEKDLVRTNKDVVFTVSGTEDDGVTKVKLGNKDLTKDTHYSLAKGEEGTVKVTLKGAAFDKVTKNTVLDLTVTTIGGKTTTKKLTVKAEHTVKIDRDVTDKLENAGTVAFEGNKTEGTEYSGEKVTFEATAKSGYELTLTFYQLDDNGTTYSPLELKVDTKEEEEKVYKEFEMPDVNVLIVYKFTRINHAITSVNCTEFDVASKEGDTNYVPLIMETNTNGKEDVKTVTFSTEGKDDVVLTYKTDAALLKVEDAADGKTAKIIVSRDFMQGKKVVNKELSTNKEYKVTIEFANGEKVELEKTVKILKYYTITVEPSAKDQKGNDIIVSRYTPWVNDKPDYSSLVSVVEKALPGETITMKLATGGWKYVENTLKVETADLLKDGVSFKMPEGNVKITANFVLETYEIVADKDIVFNGKDITFAIKGAEDTDVLKLVATSKNLFDKELVKGTDYTMKNEEGKVTVTVSKNFLASLKGDEFRIYVSFVNRAEDVMDVAYIQFTTDGNTSAKPTFTDVPAGKWYTSAVEYCAANGIFNGNPDGTFKPDAKLTRGMLVVVLYNIEGRPEVSGTADFKDVETGKWYTNAIIWAKENKVVNGYGDGTVFGPNNNITRQDFAVILKRYVEYKKLDATKAAELSAFKDASSVSSYAESAMKWAVGSEIIKGNDLSKTLNPKGNTTRAEAAAMMQRLSENFLNK